MGQPAPASEPANDQLEQGITEIPPDPPCENSGEEITEDQDSN